MCFVEPKLAPIDAIWLFSVQAYGTAHVHVYKLTHVTRLALRKFACNSQVGLMRYEEYTARERLLMS